MLLPDDFHQESSRRGVILLKGRLDVVVLVAPNGTSVVLHNLTGGSADNIQQTFTAQERPALASLNGQRSSGVWTLEVSDHQGQDVGKLNRWALIIR